MTPDDLRIISNCLLRALHKGLTQMTIPGKPRCRNLRYSLTPEGREFLTQTEEK